MEAEGETELILDDMEFKKFTPELKEKIDNADDEVKRLWELSLQLEDLTRSVGKHAAGVLIAPTKLTNFCPIYLADGMQTSQLDMSDVEKIGLVKFDFLGLRTLTIINWAVTAINNYSNNKINIELHDEAITQKGIDAIIDFYHTLAIDELKV